MSLPVFDPAVPVVCSYTIDLEKKFLAHNRFRIFSEKIYPILVKARDILAPAAYCLDNGRAGIEPVWLLGVSVLQFLERVPDRQATELLDYHSGWNLALHRTGNEQPFHFSVLHYFRDRLIEHQQSDLIFKKLKGALIQAGLIPAKSARRLDSTQMWGLVKQMSRLECMQESLRLALEEVAQSAAAFGKPRFWSDFWRDYVEKPAEYRLPAQVMRQRMDQVGADALRLLSWVKKLSDSSVAQGPKVLLLEKVLAEQFELSAGQAPRQREAQPTGAVHNPHEPQAQWAAKGQGQNREEHVGYKVQVCETVVRQKPLAKGEPTPNFITQIVTQPASQSDEKGMELVESDHAAQAGAEPPTRWYVDGAYVSGEKIAQIEAQGSQLIGPAQPAPRKEGRFSAEDFTVHIQKRRAVCPAGKKSTQCSRIAVAKSGKLHYRFEWSTHCHHCPLRQKCLGPGQRHRTLLVGQHHEYLQARRREQKSAKFRRQCQQRNALEGTLSELKRGHGMGRARYRGQLKVSLQNWLTGTACNVKRWIGRVQWEARELCASAPQVLPSG
jgi:hypothetical protein